jgi:hypothetical protein
MRKLLTEEEVERLLAKERRTYEEKEQLKYRKTLLEIKERGKLAYVVRQVIREGLLYFVATLAVLLFLAAFLCVVTLAIGSFASEIDALSSPGPEETLGLMVYGLVWGCFLLLAMIRRVILAIKLTVYDFRMYEHYIATGELNEELAVTNAERLLRKAGSRISTALWTFVFTVGAIVVGMLWIVAGVYGVYVSDKEYVFPVSVLFMVFMYGALISGMVFVGYGVYMTYVVVSGGRKRKRASD